VTGPGIPEANRDRVFEHGWTSTDNGTGIGLSLADRLLENYGGSIRLAEDDEADDGATFIATLPLA
jgi:signal transduction histidine kinase